MVERRYRREIDEKLRAGRIRIGFARHRDYSALVRMIIDLGFDFVTRAARAVAILFGRVLGIRIAALDHESFNDPVKNCSVVKSGARELLEILDRVWRGVGPKLH